MPTVAEAAAIGAVSGFTMGVVTGHFVLATVPVAIGAAAFSLVVMVLRRI